MALDNLNLEIERRAAISGSYIEAIKDFCEEKEIYDFEDVTEQLDPILIKKIETEFIKKNYFRDKKIVHHTDTFFD